jgi:hypothetical protein
MMKWDSEAFVIPEDIQKMWTATSDKSNEEYADW